MNIPSLNVLVDFVGDKKNSLSHSASKIQNQCWRKMLANMNANDPFSYILLSGLLILALAEAMKLLQLVLQYRITSWNCKTTPELVFHLDRQFREKPMIYFLYENDENWFSLLLFRIYREVLTFRKLFLEFGIHVKLIRDLNIDLLKCISKLLKKKKKWKSFPKELKAETISIQNSKLQ